MKLLEPGDMIYVYHHGKLSRRFKIDRVTEKTAFSGATKFKREVVDGYVRTTHREKWSTTSYMLETPEIIKEYNRTKIIYMASTFDWSKVDDEGLKAIYNIIRKTKDNE